MRASRDGREAVVDDAEGPQTTPPDSGEDTVLPRDLGCQEDSDMGGARVPAQVPAAASKQNFGVPGQA